MSKGLFSQEEKEYGNKYREHLFEQYKLYIEGIERISDRREGANKYFIAINTVILTALVVSFRINTIEGIVYVHTLLSVLGMVVCGIFWFLLRSYRQINTGKFQVIHKIEKKLPLALYDFEWKTLEEGKNKKIYHPSSHIEALIPLNIGFVYLILLLVNVFS